MSSAWRGAPTAPAYKIHQMADKRGASSPGVGGGPNQILRWAVIGSIIGFLLVGGMFAISTYLFSDDLVGAIAVGLFTGLLGGPGFGGMMGFVVQYSKQEEEVG